MIWKILFYIGILGLIVNGFLWAQIEYSGYIPIVGENYRVNFFVRTIIFAGLLIRSYKKSYGKN